MSNIRQNVEKVDAVWVNLKLKCQVIYPSTQAIHLKDLFDLEDCVIAYISGE